MTIKRRKTPSVQIKNLQIGSKHPIAVQSMTNTPTYDVTKTVNQIIELVEAGSELVRITIDTSKSMASVPKIIQQLKAKNIAVPIIGDFHYNGHILLSEFPESAKLLSKYRINPGNVGIDNNFSKMIKIAVKYNKPVRIGVNWGSIDKKLFTKLMTENSKRKNPKTDKKIIYDVMVQSALKNAQKAEALGLPKNKIILSAKMSDVQDVIQVNQMLAKACDYVLHIGLTEAGSSIQGITASSAALGILLEQGIGDTIRISLTPEKNTPRSLEVSTCLALLQSMKFRYFKPSVTSCPGCGRTNSNHFIELADQVKKLIDQNYLKWREKYPGSEKLHIAVMGCIVNGPGESKTADIGISLPGNNENPISPVYIDGHLTHKLNSANLFNDFKTILEKYIQTKFKSQK